MNINAFDQDLSKGAAWLAGEASGDFLASLVLPQLAEDMGHTPQYGIGGQKMIEAGLTPWYSSERLAVRGYVEVIKKLPGLIALRRQMLSRVIAADPRVFIGVDAPDFNLDIELKLRQKKIPTVHFVSPSIWAWRPERIHKIARAVDHMLLIFPFEQKIYKQAGLKATYIGHPLAGIIPMKPAMYEARQRLGIDAHGQPLFAVLPGSRIDEVSGCAPIFFQACERVIERLGGAGYFVLPAVDETRREQIMKVVAKYPKLAERLTIVTGQSHRVLEATDAVLVASGTATLEAALYKKPMVVGYTMPALSAMLMKKKGLIPYVSLPNILAGRIVVPEFLHYYCTPDAIAASLIDQLSDKRKSELVEL
ncbi:MAG: lipid-A-disaccharide synthase, partial [Sutterellaceae bacterium]|nr:lipid-A-disaccharide synthase [Sutterellaceae bacterium]